ncbi:MAG: hypothetical protein CALGDGBN_01346 [Pseudomonadales bacterium]|nr:hypothetical protein [Pseudomonadales bacterium]
MQPLQALLVDVEPAQPLAAFRRGAHAAERPDVERFHVQRFHQRHVVDARIVGQRDDRGVPVDCRAAQEVVGEILHQFDVRTTPVGELRGARVADHHAVVEHGRERGDALRHLPGADQQQPEARAQRVAQHTVGEAQRLHGVHRLGTAGAAAELQRATHAAARTECREQRLDVRKVGGGGAWLYHHREPPAARQPQPFVLLGAESVGAQLRSVAGQRTRAQALDQVLLDTAARQRSADVAVTTAGHDRAQRTRRGTDDLDDGAQPGLAPLAQPAGQRRQHLLFSRSDFHAPSRAPDVRRFPVAVPPPTRARSRARAPDPPPRVRPARSAARPPHAAGSRARCA